MRFLIIQERGRHEKNREFREALCMKRSLERAGHACNVWGLNYDNFSIPFEEVSRGCDVLVSLENYDTGWHPNISKFNGLKVFWSIDSHCALAQHVEHCRNNKFDLILNATEKYLPYFSRYVTKGVWFPNAYPADLFTSRPNVIRNVPVGFCGSSIPQRDAILNRICQEINIKRDVFVVGNDMIDALSSYQIAFNFNIADDINYRTFESTAAGAMLLTNQTPNIEKLFDVNKEIVTYRSIDELLQKVRYYLHYEQEREKIAAAGQSRAVKDHSYDTRAKQFISLLNSA